MTYSVDQDQTASVKFWLKQLEQLESSCLLLYFHSKADMSGKSLQQTTSADNVFICIFGAFKGKGAGWKN